jgi:hypothetical protein
LPCPRPKILQMSPTHGFYLSWNRAKFIMNQTYIDPEVEEWEGYYAYSSVGIISFPLLKNKHNILGCNHAKGTKKECLMVERMHRTTLSFDNIYHITIIRHCYMSTIKICHIEIHIYLRKYSISFKSPFESFKIIMLIVLIAIFFIRNQKEHINKYNWFQLLCMDK